MKIFRQANLVFFSGRMMFVKVDDIYIYMIVYEIEMIVYEIAVNILWNREQNASYISYS